MTTGMSIRGGVAVHHAEPKPCPICGKLITASPFPVRAHLRSHLRRGELESDRLYQTENEWLPWKAKRFERMNHD